MKLLVLILLLPLGACSFLDELQFNGPPGLDPSKIYLHNETVQGSRREVDQYACLSGEPLYCQGSAVLLDCHC
jgi:hypothetical protein